MGEHLDLGIIFSVFTDITDVSHSEHSVQMVQKRESVQLAAKAVVVLMRNWAGLVYLGHNQVHIAALMDALRQPSQPLIKNQILDIIFSLIKPGINNLCY